MVFPFGIVLICHLAIGLGTLAGGRRIIKTMAMKLTRLRPYQGACAEAAAGLLAAIAYELIATIRTNTDM